MARTHRNRRIALGTAGAALLVLAAGPSRADKARKASAACTAAGHAIQAAHAMEQAGRTAEALDSYRACAQQSECAPLASKCEAKMRVVDSRLPSIVLIANDETGQPVADVEVRVDGALRTSKLDGVGMPLAPGVHELSLGTSSGLSATERLMVVEGQRDRVVTMTMRAQGSKADRADKAVAARARAAANPVADGASGAPPNPAAALAPAETSAQDGAVAATSGEPGSGPSRWVLPHSPLPYAVAGVGVVGIAAGVLTTVWGNKDNTTLERRCSPDCSPAGVSHIKTLYDISDASYGVGLAALGVATWMFATSRSAEKPPAAGVARVGLHPLPSGAFASVEGAF